MRLFRTRRYQVGAATVGVVVMTAAIVAFLVTAVLECKPLVIVAVLVVGALIEVVAVRNLQRVLRRRY